MKLHELEKNIGATHKRKRVGNGPGSGLGKTCGRGQKGQNARSGGGVSPVFEGGQLPLYRRLPKRGFSNHMFKKVYAVINISDLNRFENWYSSNTSFIKRSRNHKKELSGIKVLGEGTLEKKLTIQAHKFSSSALEKIKASGSKAEVI